MATEHKDLHLFPTLSMTSIENTSITGEVARYGGFSITNGFVQKWEIDPSAANLADVRQTLCTLIGVLFKGR